MTEPGRETQTLTWGFRCSGCSRVHDPPRDLIAAWISEAPGNCACGARRDWWKMIRAAIARNHMGSFALHAVGAKLTMGEFDLLPDENKKLDLVREGVPEDARILDVNFTSRGGPLLPLPLSDAGPLSKSRSHYPIVSSRVIRGEAPRRTTVGYSALWLPHSDDVSWSMLCDAVEFHARGDVHTALILACAAVESQLRQTLAAILGPTLGKSGRERLDRLEYASLLGLVLPLATRQTAVREPGAHLIGRLQRLRGLRNELVHRGRPKSPIQPDESAELVTAALFGFRYAKHAHERSSLPRPDAPRLDVNVRRVEDG